MNQDDPYARIRELEQEVAGARDLVAVLLMKLSPGGPVHEVRIDDEALVTLPRDFVLKRWEDRARMQTVFSLIKEDGDVRV